MARGALHRVGNGSCGFHDGNEAVGEIDLAITTSRRCDGDVAAVLIGTSGASPGNFDESLFIGDICECVEVSEIRFLLRREARARDDDVVRQYGRARIEAFGAIMCETEAVKILVAAEPGSVGSADWQLEIAEAVERVCFAARSDAAAVLRPGRCVLG